MRWMIRKVLEDRRFVTTTLYVFVNWIIIFKNWNVFCLYTIHYIQKCVKNLYKEGKNVKTIIIMEMGFWITLLTITLLLNGSELLFFFFLWRFSILFSIVLFKTLFSIRKDNHWHKTSSINEYYFTFLLFPLIFLLVWF